MHELAVFEVVPYLPAHALILAFLSRVFAYRKLPIDHFQIDRVYASAVPMSLMFKLTERPRFDTRAVR